MQMGMVSMNKKMETNMKVFGKMIYNMEKAENNV
jgi:hypothetical protein